MQATNNGLNQLVNIYILKLHELAMLPTANSGFNTSQFNFIWRVAREGTPLEVSLDEQPQCGGIPSSAW